MEVKPTNHVEVLDRCLKRLHAWRVPPNWSVGDWFEEVEAIGAAVIWQSQFEFDPSRGVPLSAFLYQRVVAQVFTRYRQEWRYALHLGAEPDDELDDEGLHICHSDLLHGSEEIHESVHDAIGSLPASQRQLVELLFWQEFTECQIAVSLGITQSAVSKRKRIVLGELRSRIESARTGCGTAGIEEWGTRNLSVTRM